MIDREMDQLKDLIPDTGDITATILLIVAMVVGVRIIAGILDKVRIEKTVQEKGNQLV